MRAIVRSILDGALKVPGLRAKLMATDMAVARLKHSAAARWPSVIRLDPRNLTVAITSACNLRCIGCNYGRGFMHGHQLSLPMVRDLLDDAKTCGFRSVRLYGGEPLIHPDLPEMVRYGTDIGLRIYVTTNGILLNRHMDTLYQAGLRDVTIGFYGTDASYDEYVQKPGRFDLLRQSIEGVRRRYGNTIDLRLNWLLMRPTCNSKALHEVMTFAETFSMAIQVDLIHYSLPYFNEGPERELQFRPEDRPAIEHIVRQLLQVKSKTPARLSQSEAGLRSIPEWLIKGSDMKVPCDKYQMIWVGADGTVQLCYVTFGLGNLHQHRLRELLFSPEHYKASQDCFQLNCSNCHCGYDSRVQKHAATLRRFNS